VPQFLFTSFQNAKRLTVFLVYSQLDSGRIGPKWPAYLQHRSKILLCNLDLFISALLDSLLTFCYILVPSGHRLQTG